MWLASRMSFNPLLLPLPLLLLPVVHAELTIEETEDRIVIANGEQHILTYHKAEVPPPEGASPLYKRSGFIHPLSAPNGGVVTSIHAPDHIHHLGLWHAWVKTKHKGRSLDFWNLKKGEATVRYARTEAVRRGADGVGFTVVQEHVALPAEVILEERFSIDVALDAEGLHIVDYATAQKNVSDDALTLPAYRYGGCLAYRGPAHWRNDNSSLLTSEGRSRKDGHTTRARWCRFSGPTEQGDASLVVMGHPENHDAPQRQRIWPPENHDGAVFYNLVPIQETAWSIQPDDTATMRYRLVLSEGTPDKDAIDAWFEQYAKSE